LNIYSNTKARELLKPNSSEAQLIDLNEPLFEVISAFDDVLPEEQVIDTENSERHRLLLSLNEMF
jgi:hypothetical protein